MWVSRINGQLVRVESRVERERVIIMVAFPNAVVGKEAWGGQGLPNWLTLVVVIGRW